TDRHDHINIFDISRAEAHIGGVPSRTVGPAARTGRSHMSDRTIPRRTVLKGGAALAGALAFPAGPLPEPAADGDRPALVVLWLTGGPAGLFNSADSFLASGAFGVTTNGVRDLGNGLFVDAGSLGALPPFALAHMASVNFRHDFVRPHERARAAVLE